MINGRKYIFFNEEKSVFCFPADCLRCDGRYPSNILQTVN